MVRHSRVPHSLHLSDDMPYDLCLIVKVRVMLLQNVVLCAGGTPLWLQDPAKPIKERLAATPVAGFNKVISLTKLKKKYGQYQEKRELCASYHGFFADDRILPSLSKALGKVGPPHCRRCHMVYLHVPLPPSDLLQQEETTRASESEQGVGLCV